MLSLIPKNLTFLVALLILLVCFSAVTRSVKFTLFNGMIALRRKLCFINDEDGAHACKKRANDAHRKTILAYSYRVASIK